MPKATYRPAATRLSRWLRPASLLLALLAASPTRAAVDFHIFTDNYPPYSISQSGQSYAHKAEDIGGLCTDIVKVIMARAGYSYAMKIREWNFGYKWVQEHADHALFCTARNAEREDSFQWVGPLAQMRWTLFAAPDSTRTLATLDNARGLKIGGYKGGIISKYLSEQGLDVITSGIDRQNPLRLAQGQIDLWATDGLTGPLIAEQEAGITGLRPVLSFGETPFYLAISKQTDPARVARLQEALDDARQDGTVQAIEARYGL
ncbi:substrate-binding periplasmic protein [Marinobacter bohaiensis]|uniref:substrate-binding periplasmic protein n=1 Tax=Marinobacter bohaiensis TaxID=2201898 RepID=UPI000DAE2394|nr:ABC transporter substrate-binding protein [Marinobacter bohaiensis]